MVSTSSPQPDNDTKRQRLTLEKAKVVNLSKQLQIRLQYARLKVEHGWKRQSLNEVENLYFHHSTLKGKSKARSVSTVASPFTPSTTNGSSPKKTSVDSFPEPRQGPPPIVPVPSPPPAVVVSPPPTTTPPLAQGTGTPSLSDYSSPTVEGPSSRTPGTTPAPAPASFPPSVLSAFSQNYTVSQRAATMDFSTLSPFVSPSPFATPSASLAAPSSFVAPAPFPPQQTLAYPPSPFAPPQPSPAAIAVAHFPQPVVMQASGTSMPLSSFPALVQTQPQPPPSPASASVPAPAPTPSPPLQRTPARRTPTPVPPPPVSSSSSFRPSQKTFDIPTAPPPLGGAAGAGTLGMQSATTTTLTYDSFWSSHVSAAATATGGSGVGGWRSRAAAGGMSAPAAPTGTAAGTAGGGTKT
ncbi:hypothetical protein EDB85DRAFT_948421 [Lactarius pseudohatsudake]|nr:hypothetical protein EDB85DRAFT_948421 [Lactarius pseudohatsudake]